MVKRQILAVIMTELTKQFNFLDSYLKAGAAEDSLMLHLAEMSVLFKLLAVSSLGSEKEAVIEKLERFQRLAQWPETLESTLVKLIDELKS